MMKKTSPSFDRAALRKALGDYLHDYSTTLPAEEELSDITFSAEFEEKMDRLMHRQKRPYYYWTNTAFKKAAVILAALLLLAALATVSAGAFRSPHEYLPATCTLPMQCTHCDKTAGEPLGHVWIPATCTTPMNCSVCGETEGETLPHTYSEATCTTPKTCSECGATEGEPLPHTFETVSRVEPSCTETGTLVEKCSACGEQRTTTLQKTEHLPMPGRTCQDPTKCLYCGTIVSDQKGPHWYARIDGSCAYCGEHGPDYRPPRADSSDKSIFDGPASIFGDKGSPTPSLPGQNEDGSISLFPSPQNPKPSGHPFW